MKKKLVIANWKMNPIKLSEAKDLFTYTKKTALKLKQTRVVVCPPFVWLPYFSGKTTQHYALGAQDTFWIQHGAYTGEVSASMLFNIGVRFCIVGHSERRALGETNEIIVSKIRALLNEGITPIICVGERHRDQTGTYWSELEEQLLQTLAGISRQKIVQVLLAYEPVWAIGKTAKESMGPTELHQTILFIRKILTRLYGRKIGMHVSILYGAAVEATNATDLIAGTGISGLLVGHASLSTKMFAELLRAVDSA